MGKLMLGITLFSITLLGISFVFPSICLYYIININPQLLNNKDIFNKFIEVTSENPTPLMQELRNKTNEITKLNQRIDLLEKEKEKLNSNISNLKNEILNLREQLKLATVVVSGSVSMPFGQEPIAVIFESDGIVNKAIVKEGRYITMLENYRSYHVTIEYTIGKILFAGTCTPKNASIELNSSIKSITRDFSC